MITIRTLTLIVALSAVASTNMHAKSKTTGSSVRASKQAKRDVFVIRMAWGAAKACLGLMAGCQALEYLEVPFRYFMPVTIERTYGDAHVTHVSAMRDIFKPNSWHEAGLKKILYLINSRAYDNVFPREVMDSTGDTYLSRDRQVPVETLFTNHKNLGNSAAVFVTVASIPLAYIAYRLVRSGINTWRDEFIASAGFEDIDTVQEN
jgi:hypothetical protein